MATTPSWDITPNRYGYSTRSEWPGGRADQPDQAPPCRPAGRSEQTLYRRLLELLRGVDDYHTRVKWYVPGSSKRARLDRRMCSVLFPHCSESGGTFSRLLEILGWWDARDTEIVSGVPVEVSSRVVRGSEGRSPFSRVSLASSGKVLQIPCALMPVPGSGNRGRVTDEQDLFPSDRAIEFRLGQLLQPFVYREWLSCRTEAAAGAYPICNQDQCLHSECVAGVRLQAFCIPSHRMLPPPTCTLRCSAGEIGSKCTDNNTDQSWKLLKQSMHSFP